MKKGKALCLPLLPPRSLSDPSAALLQSRGVMPFSFAYCAAEASIIGRTIDWSEVIQSLITFQCLAVPLQELDRAAALVVHARDLERLHQAARAELPSGASRSMLRFSMPQRTCSPVIGLPLPNCSCALRIASVVTMPATMPRVW